MVLLIRHEDLRRRNVTVNLGNMSRSLERKTMVKNVEEGIINSMKPPMRNKCGMRRKIYTHTHAHAWR